MSAHARIRAYGALGAEEAVAAEHLEAVKWIGNEGSHGATDLTREDVEIAFEQCEHVLHEVYDRKTARLRETAVDINAKHRRR